MYTEAGQTEQDPVPMISDEPMSQPVRRWGKNELFVCKRAPLTLTQAQGKGSKNQAYVLLDPATSSVCSQI